MPLITEIQALENVYPKWVKILTNFESAVIRLLSTILRCHNSACTVLIFVLIDCQGFPGYMVSMATHLIDYR